MIKIAIVDDEAEMQNIIKEQVEKTVKSNEESELELFGSAEEFLLSLENGKKFDILISDIELIGMGGMELGKELRAKNEDLFLIYLTSHSQFAVESYSVEAYQYILKQEMEERLSPVLEKLTAKIERERKQYKMVGMPTDQQKIFYRDIIYICKAKSAKYVEYITADGKYRERTTLEKVKRELQSVEFIMVDRGYIVNMRHITRMKGTNIYLDNKEQVVISRARFSKVKEQINLYWRKL